MVPETIDVNLAATEQWSQSGGRPKSHSSLEPGGTIRVWDLEGPFEFDALEETIRAWGLEEPFECGAWRDHLSLSLGPGGAIRV